MVVNDMKLARHLIENEVSTLVIHLDDRSTDFLTAIYAGMGYPVLNGSYTESDLLAAIEKHSRLFMLGHGSPRGLFARNFMIDDRFGPALAKKQDGLYIWCNADSYAKRNKLSGLVSGMFISEVGEAAMFGIKATQEEVDASNAAFSKAVRSYLDTGASPDTVRKCYTSTSCKITQFNSERLYVFANGTPTPALHPSSAGHQSIQPWGLEPQPAGVEPDEFDKLQGEEQAWWDVFDQLAEERGLDLHTIFFTQRHAYSDAFNYYEIGDTPEEAMAAFEHKYGHLKVNGDRTRGRGPTEPPRPR